MSDAPEQAMKRANATDSAEYQLAVFHARDYQERLAKRRPARWRLLRENSPVTAIRVTRLNKLVTLRAMTKAKLLRVTPPGILPRRWHFTGWGLMVRDAGTRREAGVYTRTEATS